MPTEIRPTENEQELKESFDSLIIKDFIKPFNNLTNKIKCLEMYSEEYGVELDSRVDEMFSSLRSDELNIVKLEMRLRRISELVNEERNKSNEVGGCIKKDENRVIEKREEYGVMENKNIVSNELRSFSSMGYNMGEITVDPMVKRGLELGAKRGCDQGDCECVSCGDGEMSVRISTDGEVRGLLEKYMKGADKEEAGRGGTGGRACKDEVGIGPGGEAASGAKAEPKSDGKVKTNKSDGKVKVKTNAGGRTEAKADNENREKNRRVNAGTKEDRGKMNRNEKTKYGGEEQTQEISVEKASLELRPKDPSTKRRVKIDPTKRTLKLPVRDNKCGGLCRFLDKWWCCSFCYSRKRSGNYFKMTVEEWKEFLSSIEVKGDLEVSQENAVEHDLEIDELPPLVVEYGSLNAKEAMPYSNVNWQQGYYYNVNGSANLLDPSLNNNASSYYYGGNGCYAYNSGYQGYKVGSGCSVDGGYYSCNNNQANLGGATGEGMQRGTCMPPSNSPSSYKGFRGKFKGKGSQVQEEIKRKHAVKVGLGNNKDVINC